MSITPERIEEIKKEIEDKLYEHLGFNGIDGSYIYILTRVKEAFGYGTMTLDDFVEIDGDFVGELADLFIGIHSPVLVALEEAEQRAESHRKVAEANILFVSKGNDDYVYGLQEDLIEAQQTIARQREALESARSTMEDALSVAEARYKDFDTQLCPWADLSDGIARLDVALGEGTKEL